VQRAGAPYAHSVAAQPLVYVRLFGSLGRMSEWRSVWSVHLRYARLVDNGGYPYREVTVETPRELRRLIEWARRSPSIEAFPYRRIRQRYGDQPEECANGHAYVGGGSPFRVRIDWCECDCGGHMTYLCFHQAELRAMQQFAALGTSGIVWRCSIFGCRSCW